MQSNPNADYVDGKAHSLSASAHTKTSAISSEFKNFLADIEQLISEATSMTGDELAQAKTKLNDRIDSIKHSVVDMGESISNKARRGATVTNEYVHEQPWVAIGAGVAVGMLVGFLVSRRS